MLWVLQSALRQLETRLTVSFASFLHSSACLSKGGPRQKPKLRGHSRARSQKSPSRLSGPSRKRLESFSKSKPTTSYVAAHKVITAPKHFGLKATSPLYEDAVKEDEESRRQRLERMKSEKQLGREQYAAEKHKRYEQALSRHAFVGREERRSFRPTDSGPDILSKAGELAITPRPREYMDVPQKFASPPLSPGLLLGVQEVLGPRKPTDIQALSLKYMFSPAKPKANENSINASFREDILASETGSGKTLAYLLPLLNHLKQTETPQDQTRRTGPVHSPRALVLAPTHELIRQLAKVAKSLVHAKDAKLRILCSSTKNKPSSGITRNSIKVTAKKMKMLVNAEFEIKRHESEDQRKQYPVDLIFATPMRALEMIKGRGWDRRLQDESAAQVPENEDEYSEKEAAEAAERASNVRTRRGRLPTSGNSFMDQSASPSQEMREIDLSNVEWVVVDEADVLFDPDFRQYTELLLSEISAARGSPVPFITPSEDSANDRDRSNRIANTPEALTPIKYPFHLTLTSATIPLALSAYLSARHPRMTYLTSPKLHKLPAKLKIEHVPWSSGNHNSDIEAKIRAIRSSDGEDSKVLIFANKNSKVQELGEWLEQKGIKNVAMTSQSDNREYGSNKHIASFLNSPSKRAEVTSSEESTAIALREGEKPNASDPASEPSVLITTSLLSRGLDFSPSIGHVFILDTPRNLIDFLHRAGRTARAGRAGRVIIFEKESGRGSSVPKAMKIKVRKLRK